MYSQWPAYKIWACMPAPPRFGLLLACILRRVRKGDGPALRGRVYPALEVSLTRG